MDEGIELIVKNLIGLTSPGNNSGKIDTIIENFGRDMAKKCLAIEINEQQIKEIYDISSKKVAKLLGSERKPSLMIASSLDQWTDIVLEKDQVPEDLLPYMHIIKPIILGNYDLDQVNLLETKDIAALLFFSKVILPGTVSNASDNDGVTFNGVVNLVRSIYANYLIQTKGQKVNGYLQRRSQKYARGYIKYLTAHEAAHDHLWELNNRKENSQHSENMLEGFRQIYNLGKGLRGIGSYRDYIPPGFSEREALAILIYIDLNKKTHLESFDPVNENMLRPLPPNLRSSFAKYHNETQIPMSIHTSIIESASDLVADIVLADDEDYRFYIKNKSQNNKSRDFDPYTLARPFLDGLHTLVGNKMFPLLKVDPTTEEFKNPGLYLAHISN